MNGFGVTSFLLILQNHTQSLYKLVRGDVSLLPITSAIEELVDAAKQVADEMKVFLLFDCVYVPTDIICCFTFEVEL